MARDLKNWKELASSILNNSTISPDRFEFENEIETIISIRSAKLKLTLSAWLQKMKETDIKMESVTIPEMKEYIDALKKEKEFYTIANIFTYVIFTPTRTKLEISEAHSCRAQALIYMSGYHNEAMWDCQMAVKLGHPEKTRINVLKNQLLLGYSLKRGDFIADAMAEIEKLNEQKSLSNEVFDIKRGRMRFNQFVQNEWEKRHEDSDIQQNIETVTGKKLIQKSSPECGRFVVAGEKIDSDEMIQREKAFAFVPCYTNNKNVDDLQDEIATVDYLCQNCALTNCIPFPCYGCSCASYCSPKCRDEHEPVHRFECVGYQMDLWREHEIAHFAMRSLLVGIESAVRNMNILSHKTASAAWKAIVSENDSQCDYADVLALITNFDKMDVFKRQSFALAAYMLTIYLIEHTTFFKWLKDLNGGNVSMSDQELEKLIAALLLRHMGQINMNAIGVFDNYFHDMKIQPFIRNKFVIKENQIITHMRNKRIFTAIFPRISLVNHSCDPNTRNCFDGAYLKIYASRDISEGSEVVRCYGRHYKAQDTKHRKQFLMEWYCFDCKCEKCATNDKATDQYYQMHCYNCKKLFVDSPFPGKVKDWWISLKYPPYFALCLAQPNAFVCSNCGLRSFDNLIEIRDMLELTIQTLSTFTVEERARKNITIYFGISKSLCKNHVFKIFMLPKLILHLCTVDDDLFKKMAYIVVECYITARDIYGIYSLEFVAVTKYALSILEKIHAKLNLKGASDENDRNKIIKILSLKQMRKSWTIVSTSTRQIFENYVENNFVEKTPYECGCDISAALRIVLEN